MPDIIQLAGYMDEFGYIVIMEFEFLQWKQVFNITSFSRWLHPLQFTIFLSLFNSICCMKYLFFSSKPNSEPSSFSSSYVLNFNMFFITASFSTF